MESLKTRDVEVARPRAAFRNAEVETLFQQAKLSLKTQEGTVLVLPPTTDEQDFIREAVRAHVLAEDEAVRLAKPDENTLDVYEGLRADQYEDAGAGLRSGRVA